ncbi:hypothetical protein ASPWEDRAFT_504431 [Aspergillus wentii DTO 134E9]|uniref:Uncharacterized protein n=1 Tax=Aspergillus wentii DTO 134E9 TaxID=1073089 RepID=A0A1L9RKB1_ASPWE|nr:uncharacterized protein ASPWEDRAFT_504431 [Aspergillus wentii DTO 134E9]KAI9923577.1 hypothetical protein MW887_008499 [Aspergillus wentii]OJJ35288.1 hypothetical protein ASPWEDRAFT_504431 [Aspergillus wentii DTO 134E9]
MAADFSNPESLGVLTSTVNQTLIETGRFFRSAGSMQSRAQLKRSLPAAHEQFQLALDSLSEQIFIAKAFLEKDYEVIRAKKAELQPAKDVVMGEAAEKEKEPEPNPQPTEKVESGADAEQTEANPADENATSAEPAAAAAEPDKPNTTDQPVKTENQEENTKQNQPFNGAEELNFDSVLNDTGGTNDFDLNLDFGDDEIGNQNFLSGSNLGNAGTSAGADNSNNKDQANPSALPEIGNNTTDTPAGGDAFDMEFQKADAQLGNNTEDVMAPGESSFDDLFLDTDNFGGDGMGDQGLLEGDGLMNINELDDSWFN